MRILALLVGLLAFCAPAHSQQYIRVCYDPPTGTVPEPNCQNVNNSYPFPVTLLAPPGGAIQGNSTGTTGSVVGTLAGVSGKTTYICGFSVSALGGSAAVGPITIAGPTTSLVYYLASSTTGVNLTQNFSPCIPASAANTAITTTTTADGSASNVAVNSWGFQQ